MSNLLKEKIESIITEGIENGTEVDEVTEKILEFGVNEVFKEEIEEILTVSCENGVEVESIVDEILELIS